uniref:COMM domain-containing protein n=1 Tax=Schistocephalus solidus TaxID=70667 RepID=A0A183TR74_SCHSO
LSAASEESVVDFQRHFRSLARQAYPNDSFTELVAKILENVVAGISLPEIGRQFLLDSSSNIKDTFQNFWVLTQLKLSSVLMAFMDSESCAGLHAEGNITGSADLNRLISQSTANSRSQKYLLVQNIGPVTLNEEFFHWAPVLTRPCPEL